LLSVKKAIQNACRNKREGTSTELRNVREHAERQQILPSKKIRMRARLLSKAKTGRLALTRQKR